MLDATVHSSFTFLVVRAAGSVAHSGTAAPASTSTSSDSAGESLSESGSLTLFAPAKAANRVSCVEDCFFLPDVAYCILCRHFTAVWLSRILSRKALKSRVETTFH